MMFIMATILMIAIVDERTFGQRKTESCALHNHIDDVHHLINSLR